MSLAPTPATAARNFWHNGEVYEPSDDFRPIQRTFSFRSQGSTPGFGNTTESDAEPDVQPPTLLTLPIEIRLRILKCIISHGEVVDLNMLSGFGETATELINIRSTSSQLNIETKGLVWKLNTFRVNDMHVQGHHPNLTSLQKLPIWSRLQNIEMHGIYFAKNAGDRTLTTARWLENRLLENRLIEKASLHFRIQKLHLVFRNYMEEKKLFRHISHFARLKVQQEIIIQVVTSQSCFGRRTEFEEREPEEMKWLAARFKERAEMMINEKMDCLLGQLYSVPSTFLGSDFLMFNFDVGPVSDTMTASSRMILFDWYFYLYIYLKITRCRVGCEVAVKESGRTITEFDDAPKDDYLMSALRIADQPGQAYEEIDGSSGLPVGEDDPAFASTWIYDNENW